MAYILFPVGLCRSAHYEGRNRSGKALIQPLFAAAASYVNFNALGLDPVALDLGFFTIKWYSLAYIAGIIMGWWYMLRLIAQPGAPMARRHVDDLVFYMTLGIILGGRIGYVLFYKPSLLANPLDLIKLWEGGMSFHGGLLGVLIALFLFVRRHKLDYLRVHDYVALCVPFGLFFGRIANFVNGELWGRPTTVPWAIVFPLAGDEPRHPSQLYEAGLEGIALFAALWFFFWKTDARYQPGKLAGTFALGYGLSRVALERVRQPDAGLENLPWGLTMGQTLSVPMIALGLYLILTAKNRGKGGQSIPAGAQGTA
jgi:phosphatidylglycerol---prolipoprotein diacylglyceryl transferase